MFEIKTTDGAPVGSIGSPCKLEYKDVRKLLGVIIFLFIIQVGNGQTINAVKLADDLLKAGTCKAAITTYDFPSDVKSIQEKAIKSLKSQPEWADKYIVVELERGSVDIPKSLDAYGLNEKEFEIMIAGFKKRKKAFFSDTTSLIIDRSNGLIAFRTSNALSLFNYLSIDLKHGVVHFDNLITTKELPISGKFYAPNLNGFETHSSERTSAVNKSGIANFGFAVGVNAGGDPRPSMTLIYGKGELNDTKFISITLL